jgi:hypothetical protein
MKVLVTGGRNYSNKEFLYSILDTINSKSPISLIIHGGANGADKLSGDWGTYRDIDVKVYKADWDTHGKKAGILRNIEMLDDSKPDLVVAFFGGNGTLHMKTYAKKQGYKVLDLGVAK